MEFEVHPVLKSTKGRRLRDQDASSSLTRDRSQFCTSRKNDASGIHDIQFPAVHPASGTVKLEDPQGDLDPHSASLESDPAFDERVLRGKERVERVDQITGKGVSELRGLVRFRRLEKLEVRLVHSIHGDEDRNTSQLEIQLSDLDLTDKRSNVFMYGIFVYLPASSVSLWM